MAVELIGISKFKLQLLALVSEARHLRESERNARDELDLCKQRQQQIEAEYGQRLQELSAELASRDESQRKLEAKVRYLEHENAWMEKKERELKETVNGLLQSRGSFLSVYENSTHTLRCAIAARDKKLGILSEKIHAHLLLFDSIEKETAAVKQVLDRVQDLVNEKEHVVTGLKVKMDSISAFEKDFVEKICLLESKLRDYHHEIRRRNAIIAELKENLEAQKIKSNFQPQIEELQRALLVKEEVIQTLTSEKQALHLELQSLELSLHKIQDVVSNTCIENQTAFSTGMGVQEVSKVINKEENESLEYIFEDPGEDSSTQDPVGCITENAVLPEEQPTPEDESSRKRNAAASCFFQPSNNSFPRQVCFGSVSINVNPDVSTDGNVVNNTLLVNDSENSTTGAEALEGLHVSL